MVIKVLVILKKCLFSVVLNPIRCFYVTIKDCCVSGMRLSAMIMVNECCKPQNNHRNTFSPYIMFTTNLKLQIHENLNIVLINVSPIIL